MGKADGGEATPMMAQYLGIKEANPNCILFYRMGDFYELFLDDAVTAAPVLGIALTRRGKHQGADIPMCGVPVDRADDYLNKLIAHGLRVGVCEQVEDPAAARARGAKAVVRREVVRLVTPGTVTEETLLSAGEPSRLVAVARPEAGGPVGVASADITTGCLTVSEVPAEGLEALLARLEAREVVADDALADDPACGPALSGGRHALTRAANRQSTHESACRVVRDWYGVSTLDGFGGLTRAEVAATAAALSYVARTQMSARPNLRPPSRIDAGNGAVGIDAATRASLEITRTMSGERRGSLAHAMDHTVTPAGARLLSERLAGPVTDTAVIAGRLDDVAWAVAAAGLRPRLRAVLRGMTDLSRATSRLALGRGGPRDLAAVRDGLARAAEVAAMVAGADPSEGMAAAARSATSAGTGLREALASMLADELPPHARDGGFVRAGHDAALDGARALRDEARSVVAALQARYAGETGVRTLRIKHNGQIGYFVEVPQAAADTLRKAGYAQRQSMSDAVRFSTAELADLDGRIATAGETALGLERAAFDLMSAKVAKLSETLNTVADAVAEVDLACSMAEVAASRGWCRPEVDDTLAFEVRGGRHPVVEEALRAAGAAFVPNDCVLTGKDGSGPGRVAVVTGPNMAGKSTFLRQNAIVALLAQCGSFVPATSARIGVVDRIFSRVGASDDLARGRSTFMVEMVETAAILNGAGNRSLVVMDEIGRGTATYDGLSLAWAAVEHLHDANGARCLFATHYHELTALSRRKPRVFNLSMRVVEHDADVTFAHEVVDGAAGKSYGIHVARLAGLPPSALARAGAVLADLEGKARKAQARSEPPPPNLFDFAEARGRALPDPTLAALDAIDPDAMTPREALQALYDLKATRGGAPSRKTA